MTSRSAQREIQVQIGSYQCSGARQENEEEGGGVVEGAEEEAPDPTSCNLCEDTLYEEIAMCNETRTQALSIAHKSEEVNKTIQQYFIPTNEITM